MKVSPELFSRRYPAIAGVIGCGVASAILVGSILYLQGVHSRHAQYNGCQAFVVVLEQALTLYKNDAGDYPPSGAEGLALLITTSSSNGEPYIKFSNSHIVNGRVVDSWGQPIVYRNNPKDKRDGKLSPRAHYPNYIDLYSIGPNGIDEQGGGDDINNWD